MKSLFLLSILFFSFTGFSQSYEYRMDVEAGFALLENKNNLIPLQSLDTLQISYLSYGNDEGIFLESMRRYADISDNNSKSNLLIIAVFDDNSGDFNKIIENSENVIICFFQNNSFVNFNLDLENIQAIIEVNGRDSIYKDYCGQFIFGGFTVQGQGIRFKYTNPQELGLDSAFIYHKVDSIVNFAIKNTAMPGCQIFVAVNQKVIFHKSYGFHTYDSLIPVKNSDLYDLASITKIAASAPALMKMYENQLIDIHKPLSKYYKKLKFSNKKDLLLIDILCHQANLKAWIPFWKYSLDKNQKLIKKYYIDYQKNKNYYPVCENLYIKKKYHKKVLKLIKKSELETGNKYVYSDLSFYFYPDLVKKLTKKDFETFLTDEFYSKLGANSLMFNPLNKFTKTQIVPTEIDNFFRKTLINGYVHDEGAAMCNGVSGHAGLFANANDLAKLMQMFLNYGKYGNYRYIDSLIVKEWTSFQFPENNNRRGIVFDKPLLENKEQGTPSQMASDLSFGHTGFTGTFVWADPQNGLLFVFLSNRVYPTRDNKNLTKYNIRTNIHDVFYQAIEKRDKAPEFID